MQMLLSIQSIQYFRSSDRGFSIAELLVTSFLGLMVMSLAMSAAIANKTVLGKDKVRTQVAQNLRGALDIIGMEARIGGENLGSGFPAIEITNGASSAPDTLFVRRNLLDEVLPLCVAITAGTNVTDIVFANSPVVAGCVYSSHTHDYTAWQTYRTTHSNTVDAYIFDSVSKKGEFFKYNGETNNGTQYSVTRVAGTWTNSYPAISSTIYILEEWKFQVSSGILQLIQNRDNANANNVAFNITDFQVQALMQDGTTKTAFAPTDAWISIKQIQIDLSGAETFAQKLVTRTVTGKFFPRNVLSN